MHRENYKIFPQEHVSDVLNIIYKINTTFMPQNTKKINFFTIFIQSNSPTVIFVQYTVLQSLMYNKFVQLPDKNKKNVNNYY